MGLIRSQGPQPWHPAPPLLREAVQRAAKVCIEMGTTLEKAALGYGLCSAEKDPPERVPTPTVAGFSNVDEVKAALALYEQVYGDEGKRGWRSPEEDDAHRAVLDIFRRAGYADWSWLSPPLNA
jgi:D-arabinose 1-dehydrogenase